MEYLKEIARLSLQSKEEVGGYVRKDVVALVRNIALDRVNSYAPQNPIPPGATFWHSHNKGGFSEQDIKAIWATDYPWMVFDKSTRKFYLFDKNAYYPYLGREWQRGLHDCYCLVRDWYRFELAYKLPDPLFYLGDENPTGVSHDLDRILRNNFYPIGVATIQNHDLAIWKDDNQLKHVGVLINVDHQWKILHHPRNQLSQLLEVQDIQHVSAWRFRQPLPSNLLEPWEQSLVVNLSYRQIDLVRSSLSVAGKSRTF